MRIGSNLDLQKVVKNLGQKMKLVPHLDMALSRGDFEWEFTYECKQGDDAWHPSGDCTPSLYDLYCKASGQLEEAPIGPGLRKIFMTGHFWHQYLQWVVEKRLEFAGPDDIERRGSTVWTWQDPNPPLRETAPKPYHWATGSADVCPCRIPGQGDYLIDFKTVNPRMYAYGLSDEYMGKYECQGNIYMSFFDMERILFVMIDKSNGDMKEMEFERNQPLIDAIYGKWKLVSVCLDEGITPPEDEEVHLPLKGPIAA